MDMLDCGTVLRQLWDYLDGELTRERALRLAEHLSVCQRCHPRMGFDQAFLAALAASRGAGAASPMLRQRVLATLQAAGLDPPPRA